MLLLEQSRRCYSRHRAGDATAGAEQTTLQQVQSRRCYCRSRASDATAGAEQATLQQAQSRRRYSRSKVGDATEGAEQQLEVPATVAVKAQWPACQRFRTIRLLNLNIERI